MVIQQMGGKGCRNEFVYFHRQKGFPADIYVSEILQVIGKKIQLGLKGNIFHQVFFQKGSQVTSEFAFDMISRIHAKGSCIGQDIIFYKSQFVGKGSKENSRNYHWVCNRVR